MKFKYIILSVGSVLLASILNVIAYFAAFAITVMAGGVSVIGTEEALVNQGIFNVVRYTLIMVICGYIYYYFFYLQRTTEQRAADIRGSIRYCMRPLTLIGLLLCGAAIQLGTDSVLYSMGVILPDAFASYRELMATFSGSSSTLFIITTITLGPIAEELIFRGLALRCAYLAFEHKKRAYGMAIIIQALLFGIYHGNIIQAVYAFIFGLLLGYLAVKTQSLIPSTLLHIIINGCFYLIPDGLFSSLTLAIIIFHISLVIFIISMVIIHRTFNAANHSDVS